MRQETESTVSTFDELHQFVHHTLCAAENLLMEQFTTHQRRLVTKENLSGIEYSLQGLRNIRLGAIWAADQNVIYFYNARGERYLKVKVEQRLPIDSLAVAS